MLVFRNALQFHHKDVATTENDRRIRDFARFLERAFSASYEEHYHSEDMFQKRLNALKDGRREPDLTALEKKMLQDREERSKAMSELVNLRKFMGEINKVHRHCTHSKLKTLYWPFAKVCLHSNITRIISRKTKRKIHAHKGIRLGQV